MSISSYDTKEIETNRLILKKGSIEDFVKVYEYDMRKLRNINGEFEFVKQDSEEIRSWFSDGIDKHYEKKAFDWIIYLKNNMIPIGNITADRENKEENSTQLAFNLHPNYWGKGHMIEALKSVLDHLFSVGYDNVITGWDSGNNRSKRISEKLGFKPTTVKENAWVKDGVPITTYESVMDKEMWQQIKKYDMSSVSINTPKGLLSVMKEKLKYGYVGTDGSIHVENLKDFRELYRTGSVQSIMKNRLVTCIESAIFAKAWFDSKNIECKLFCHRAYENDVANDKEVKMHIIILFKEADKWYHFEHTNRPKQGIHEYETLENAISNIISEFELKGDVRLMTEVDYIPEGLTFKEFNDYVNHIDELKKVK